MVQSPDMVQASVPPEEQDKVVEQFAPLDAERWSGLP